MPEPLQVTEDDVLEAYFNLYARAPEFSHIPVQPPDPEKTIDRLTLDGLRRVLEQDRRRVLERSDVVDWQDQRDQIPPTLPADDTGDEDC